MAQTELIAAVDQAMAALKAARKVLVVSARQEARSKSTTATKLTKATKKTAGSKSPAKKGMSEEGRLRIAAAQRKRWAVSKKAAKKAARLAAN
jgi:hypothetical protein